MPNVMPPYNVPDYYTVSVENMGRFGVDSVDAANGYPDNEALEQVNDLRCASDWANLRSDPKKSSLFGRSFLPLGLGCMTPWAPHAHPKPKPCHAGQDWL